MDKSVNREVHRQILFCAKRREEERILWHCCLYASKETQTVLAMLLKDKSERFTRKLQNLQENHIYLLDL